MSSPEAARIDLLQTLLALHAWDMQSRRPGETRLVDLLYQQAESPAGCAPLEEALEAEELPASAPTGVDQQLYQRLRVAAPLRQRLLAGPKLSAVHAGDPAALSILIRLADVTPNREFSMLDSSDALFLRILERWRQEPVTPEQLLLQDLARLLDLNREAPAVVQALVELASGESWQQQMAAVERALERPNGAPALPQETTMLWQEIKALDQPDGRNIAADILLGRSRLSTAPPLLLRLFPTVDPAETREDQALEALQRDRPDEVDTLRRELQYRLEAADFFLSLRKFAKLDALAYKWPKLYGLFNLQRAAVVEFEQYVNEPEGARDEPTVLSAPARRLWEVYAQDEDLMRFLHLRPLLNEVYKSERERYQQVQAQTAAPAGARPEREAEALETAAAKSVQSEEAPPVTLHLRPVRPEILLRGHDAMVLDVALTPDGKRAVSASRDRTLRVWNLDSEDPSRSPTVLRGHDAAVHRVAVTPDGRRAISASEDGALRTWELDGSDEAAAFVPILRDQKSGVASLAATPDGQRAIIATTGGELEMRDLDWEDAEDRTEPQPTLMTRHEENVNAAAVTPDERRAIFGFPDGSLRVWELQPGVSAGEVAELRGHKGGVLAVALTPDGKRIVSASSDSTLRVWDLEDGDWPVDAAAVLRGHQNAVLDVAVLPDGRRIVSASADGTLRVWDLDSASKPTVTAVLRGHQGQVQAVAVTPDGKRAVSASEDGTLLVWDLEGANGDVNAFEMVIEHDGVSVAGPLAMDWRGLQELETKLLVHADPNEPVEERFRELGRWLFFQLFKREAEKALLKALRPAMNGRAQRVLFQADAPEFHRLPWESVYVPPPVDRLICASSHFSVPRCVPGPAAEEPVYPESQPLRVLVLLQAPADGMSVDLDYERSLVERSLGDAAHFQAKYLDNATWGIFGAVVRQEYPHVVHIVAPATPETADPGRHITFVNDRHESDLWPAGEVAAVLREGRVKMVVLSPAGTPTRTMAVDVRTIHTAVRLAGAGLPAVVAPTRMGVSSVPFHRTLYRALADGQSVEAAVLAGRRTLKTENQPWIRYALFAGVRQPVQIIT